MHRIQAIASFAKVGLSRAGDHDRMTFGVMQLPCVIVCPIYHTIMTYFNRVPDTILLAPTIS